jgi:hypothetical protein
LEHLDKLLTAGYRQSSNQSTDKRPYQPINLAARSHEQGLDSDTSIPPSTTWPSSKNERTVLGSSLFGWPRQASLRIASMWQPWPGLRHGNSNEFNRGVPSSSISLSVAMSFHNDSVSGSADCWQLLFTMMRQI